MSELVGVENNTSWYQRRKPTHSSQLTIFLCSFHFSIPVFPFLPSFPFLGSVLQAPPAQDGEGAGGVSWLRSRAAEMLISCSGSSDSNSLPHDLGNLLPTVPHIVGFSVEFSRPSHSMNLILNTTWRLFFPLTGAIKFNF